MTVIDFIPPSTTSKPSTSQDDTISGDGRGSDSEPLGSPSTDLPCRTGDVDLWFAESPAELERAKSACGPCPLRAECLDTALRRREPWGVWGGEIFDGGEIIARKRPRGRPRKAAV